MTRAKQLALFILVAYPSSSTASKTDPSKDDRTIVVTASKTEKTLADSVIATELITRSELEQTGARTAADALEEQSGIQIIRSPAGIGLRLQGLDSKYILILVDGERINGRIGGTIDLQRFPAEQIERIEIVKGPASALYGSDAIGGVINIITRTPSSLLEGDAKFSYGTNNMAEIGAYVGWRNDSWKTQLTAGWYRRDAYDLDSSDLQTNGSAFSNYNITQKTNYKFDKEKEITASTSYQYRLRNGIDSNTTGAIFDRRNLTEFFSTKLSSKTRFPNSGLIRLSGQYNIFRDQFVLDQRNSSALDKDEETRDQLAQINGQYDHLLFTKHLFTLGTEAAFEKLEADRLIDKTSKRYRLALFAQDDWSILDTPFIAVIPGLRLDLDSEYGTHLSSKIALRYDATSKLIFRAGYGGGFRAPSFKELYLLFENPGRAYKVEGNPELEPEKSHGVSVSSEYRVSSTSIFSLSAFRNDISNLIFIEKLEQAAVGGADRYSYINLSSAVTQGLEINAQFKVIKQINLKFGYALTDSENKEAQRPLEGRSLHRGTLQVGYNPSKWGTQFSVKAAINGPAPFYADNNGDGTEEVSHSEPYTTIDLRIGQTLFEHFTFFINADNILNAGDPRFFPIQPLNIYGGISAKV